ncbi:uncharacterized protein LOC108628636 [Ceratina calcarata]|uniref:Uncharacterized protein LOC108628636 n=1 Tax=Ceratina calcarata TaxID=156304 RepID=A0AAJ7J7U3_9HYME|nr:uncharacterized protein LOC108628636 [Ceratina calcarata]
MCTLSAGGPVQEWRFGGPYGRSERVKGLLDHNIDATVVKWINRMLSDRIITTEHGEITAEGLANRGCPQGGILSPTLWCLAVNSPPERLKAKGFEVWRYADDIAVVTSHENEKVAKRWINSALKIVEDWCAETRIKFNGVQLKLSGSVKYLDVTFTSTLSWRLQVDKTLKRARNNLATVSRMVGSTWGLTPAASHWIFKAIIIPRLTFGALIWYSPIRAMEAMLAIPTLTQRIEEAAIRTAKLLKDWEKWSPSNKGHSTILFKTAIPERDEWKNGRLDRFKGWKTWFTDGSKNESGNTGCAWVNGKLRNGKTEFLGKFATVYKAEVIAVTRCVEEMLTNGVNNESIVIFTDSESTTNNIGKKQQERGDLLVSGSQRNGRKRRSRPTSKIGCRAKKDRYTGKRRQIFGTDTLEGHRIREILYKKLISFFKAINPWDKIAGVENEN